jgi:hypothetical protein
MQSDNSITPQVTHSFRFLPILFMLILLMLAIVLIASARSRNQQSLSKQPIASAEISQLGQNFTLLGTLGPSSSTYCSWSSDGKIVNMIDNEPSNSALQSWDVSNGKPSGDPITTSMPYCSPNQTIAALVSSTNTINLVDTHTGQLLRTLNASVPPDSYVDTSGVTKSTQYDTTSLRIERWSNDGTILVTTSVVGTLPESGMGPRTTSVQRWDVASGTRLSYKNVYRDTLPMDISISPDGALFATGRAVQGPSSTSLVIDLWDLSNQSQIGTLTFPWSTSNPYLFWSPDGHTLAVIVDGRQVALIDSATAKVTMTLPETLPDPYTPTPNPKPQPIGTSAADPIPSPQSTAEGAVPIAIQTAVPPGYVPPVTPAAQLPDVDNGDYQPITNIVWSPDGSTIAVYDNSYIRFWDATTGKQRAIARHPYNRCDRSRAMGWSPDQRLFASIDCDEELLVLRLWDGTTAAPVRELITGVYDLHWSPSSTNLLLLANNQLWGIPKTAPTTSPLKTTNSP